MARVIESADRRNFIKNSSLLGAGIAFPSIINPVLANSPMPTSMDERNIIGPKEGFTPKIGTLVSMMNWMRYVILLPVNGMKIKDLDYLLDEKANSIGAMLLHLAASERYYQLNTFDNMEWGSWSKEIKATWDTPSGLGDEARKKIKGNDLNYYLDIMSEVREKTLLEFKKRDDDWLMSIDESWPWGPTNNYCKWFHVCEHESNHNGQIKLIKSRIS